MNLRGVTRLVACTLTVGIVVLLDSVLPAYSRSLLLEIFIWSLFAISFDLLFGYTGMLSFGQSLYFGVGAYCAALSMHHWNVHPLIAIVLGALGGGLVSLMVVPVIVRVTSHYFVIITVLLSLVVSFAANSASNLTGGDDGIPINVPRWTVPFFPNVELPDRVGAYMTYVIVIGVVCWCWYFVRSPIGLILSGIRENPRRAQFLGYRLAPYRGLVWVIAGTVAGLSGGLIVVNFCYVSTSYLHWTLSGEAVVWTIIGGKGTLLGPVLGTTVFVYFKDYLSSWFAAYPLLVGLALILLISFAPAGILGVIRRTTFEDWLFRVISRKALPSLDADAPSLLLDLPPAGRCFEPLLSIESVSKRFKGVVAVDRVTFELGSSAARVLTLPDRQDDPTQFSLASFNSGRTGLSIVGPNGAGKTTFFNLLTGLVRPDSGTILFKGKGLFREKKGLTRASIAPVHEIATLGIARTFQHSNLFPHLSVIENLWLSAQRRQSRHSLFRAASGNEATADTVAQILKLTGLEPEADQSASALSFGRQKMLEIGLAIATAPALLLLDEPTAGVSPHEISKIINVINAISKQIAVLVVEHDMEVVKRLDFQILVFGEGRIVSVGTPEAVFADKVVQDVFLGW